MCPINIDLLDIRPTIKTMKWIWQHKNWPNFEYDPMALSVKEDLFKTEAAKLVGASSIVSDTLQQQFTIDLMSEEALKSSRIEGELLDRESVASSILQQFGFTPPHHKILAGDREKGIAALMVDNYRSYEQPLSHDLLCKWHPFVVTPSLLVRTIGDYRNSTEPMRIVSGYEGNQKVHYEAPPSIQVHSEMERYIQWFNETGPSGSQPLPPLARAGIPHIYFEAIHPFDDGNGRLGRALSEKALAQSIGKPGLFALSHKIESNRVTYYKHLEITQKGVIAIDTWLDYFSDTIIDAASYSNSLLRFIVEKTRLYDRIQNRINDRQAKALSRMFAEGVDGFKGGMSAAKYMKITGTISKTATRDLQALVHLGALVKTGQLKGTRYWLNLGEEFDGPRKAHLAGSG